MNARLLSRQEAASYCQEKGFPVAPASLAKYASVGGGPEFHSFGRFPRYSTEALDRWLASKLSAPRANTSQAA